MWQEILCNLLENREVEVYFPQLKNVAKLLETRCYKALCEIREVLKNSALTDGECFARIEEIVCVFEKMGVNCGARQDF